MRTVSNFEVYHIVDSFHHIVIFSVQAILFIVSQVYELSPQVEENTFI